MATVGSIVEVPSAILQMAVMRPIQASIFAKFSVPAWPLNSTVPIDSNLLRFSLLSRPDWKEART